MMNILLDHEGFEKNLINTQSVLNGVQYLFKFENDYGASVIKFRGSYGYEEDLWELAVIKYIYAYNYTLTYDTPITNNVVGHLTDEDVRKLLKQIKEL